MRKVYCIMEKWKSFGFGELASEWRTTKDAAAALSDVLYYIIQYIIIACFVYTANHRRRLRSMRIQR